MKRKHEENWERKGLTISRVELNKIYLCKSLPKEVAETTSLGSFKIGLYKAIEKILQGTILHWQVGWTR